MNVEKPKLHVLKAITPSPESIRSGTLEYANLEEAVATHRPFEKIRSEEFWDAEDGSLEELDAAKELAQYYMLLGSRALQMAGTDDGKNLWSDRYTQATNEIYGIPDEALARRLWEQRESGQDIELEQSFEVAATELKQFIEVTYQKVFVELEEGLSKDSLTPEEVVDRFERGLSVLASEYDEDWALWTVERNQQKDSLSVVASEKKIIVGMHRADLAADQLRPLFTHEVLIHAQRSVNGLKLSEKLGEGLSGYMEAEEGLGVFAEYALTGKISQKIIDRYIDIAYALGQIDGNQHTRAELLELTQARLAKRNASAERKLTQDQLDKEAYAGVNRMYRGSLGNEHIGIYTKDIAYYQGFIAMGEYIADRLEQGETIEQVMSWLLSGKFDPQNDMHVRNVYSTAGGLE